MTTTTVPKREDVPVAHTWDTASVFPSDAAWEEEVTALLAALPEFAALRGHLESAGQLAEGLTRYTALLSRLRRVYLYATMFYATDTADPGAVAKHDTAASVAARISAAVAFLDPELLQIGFDTLRRWQTEDSRLATYAHYFEMLERQQAHVRSAEIQEVLGLVNEPFSAARQTHTILTDADLRFEPAYDAAGQQIPITQGTITELLQSADREVRRTAWEHYADAHLALKNTMASALATGIKQDVFVARVRRYPSALDAAVDSKFIPPAVFHALIETFRAHLPLWHRYWDIRRRALRLDRLHVYDIKAPLSASTPHVPFAQAVEWIAQGLAPLGDQYVQTLRRGVLEQRWVDIYPNQGKRAGAFSTGVQGTHPFVLMSYTDDLASMSTLAHELGHSLHSYFTWKTQPPVYADYTIFVAEVASTFNQALVRAHLFATNPDPEFQIAVIEEAMSNFHRYFFIMPTLARFELEVHQRAERGLPLTAGIMNGLMTDLFSEGYGPDMAIDTARVGSTWAQFPTHLYSNFYVYQYATGISAAHALADQVLAGTPGAVDRYLAFLKAGSSRYPMDVLREAGVDLATPEPVEKTFGVLAGLIDRLEQLMQRR